MGRELVLQFPQWETVDEVWVIARRTERLEALKEDFERISSKLVSMVYAPIGKTGGEKLERLLNKVLVSLEK